MSNKVVMHQPDFIPWMGFFEKIKMSDIYVILDDVQYLKKGFHNRDKILIDCKPKWITIPVKNKNNFKKNINQIEIHYEDDWVSKLLKQISLNYKKKKNFDKYFPSIENIFQKRKKKLIYLNLDLLNFAFDALNIKKNFFF